MDSMGPNSSPGSETKLSLVTKSVIAIILIVAAIYSLAIESGPVFFILTAIIIGVIYALFRIVVSYRN